MSFERRLNKVEACPGLAGMDAGLTERLNRMRHENIVIGLQKFGFSETDARKYADLAKRGIEKYGRGLGYGGWMRRLKIENWNVVPLDFEDG